MSFFKDGNEIISNNENKDNIIEDIEDKKFEFAVI